MHAVSFMLWLMGNAYTKTKMFRYQYLQYFMLPKRMWFEPKVCSFHSKISMAFVFLSIRMKWFGWKKMVMGLQRPMLLLLLKRWQPCWWWWCRTPSLSSLIFNGGLIFAGQHMGDNIWARWLPDAGARSRTRVWWLRFWVWGPPMKIYHNFIFVII